MPTLDLAADYAECKKLHARHGKTYYFSTLFFPAHLRKRVHALYGFVRYPDELVDNPAPGSDPAAALQAYRDDTLRALETGDSRLPVLRAFADMAREVALPPSLPLAFLDAMTMDLTRARYKTFADLQEYTYGSASVVGLMMCRVLGVDDPEALSRAHDLGLAMQLTNFWRDIGEDFTLRGRIYLPMDDLAEYGVTEADIARGRVTPAFVKLLKFEINRAREYYQSADIGIPLLPPEGREPVRLARELYAQILDKIEANGYDVFSRRARTSALEKAAAVVRGRVASR